MKFFLYMALSFTLLFSISVENKIKKNKKALSSKKTEYKKMDKELSFMAKKINSAKKERRKLDIKLSTLSKNIKNNEITFKELQKEDKRYLFDLIKLNKQTEKKKKNFLNLVAKNFSLALALEELKQPTEESVMMREAYKLYEMKNDKEIVKLSKDIEYLNANKKILQIKKSNIQKIIEQYEVERKEFKHKKQRQDKLVKKLARDKAIYKKRFNRLKASRKSLEQKLAKLKIIKYSKDKAAKEKRRAKTRLKFASKAPRIIASIPTAKYRGSKTISPLKGARLIKKFGTYIDPIYKFKIFNKSITLKAPHVGSKVRSVLAGKVVFAENSGGMLGKVVIVEHTNNMHTIYAKLSRLAPGIYVGKRLFSGTIIGKVDKSLMFEVTKNNKHMNPLKLIRL